MKFFKTLLVIPATSAAFLANAGLADISTEDPKSNVSEKGELIAQSSEDSQTLKITVSGTKTPREVKDLPATVSVFNDVHDEQGSDIRDLLKYETGVSTKNNIFHGLQEINIRGMEGNRVLIEQDGVRVPTLYTFGPYNVGRGQYIDSSSINSLEVLRGPASSLYGSDALGGVVSFRSLEASDLLKEGETRRFEIPITYDGSNHGTTGTIRWAEDAGKAKLLFSYTAEDSSNSDTKASAEFTNEQENEGNIVYGNFGYDLNENSSISLSVENLSRESETTEGSGNLGVVYGRFQSKYVYDNSVDKSKVVLNYKYVNEDLNKSSFFDDAIANLYHQNAEVDDNRFEWGTRTSGTKNYFREDIYEFNEEVTGFDLQLVKNREISNANHKISYGGSYSNTRNERPRSKFETDLDTGIRTAGISSTPTLDFPNTDTKRLGIFLQDEITFNNNFELIAGLRYDAYDLSPKTSSIFPSESASYDSTALSPKIALTYNIDEETKFYGQYSRGFRPPNYNEINNGFTNLAGAGYKYETLSNPDLDAETSNTFEIGVKKASSKFDINLGAYYSKYEDFISFEGTGTRCLTTIPGCPPSFVGGYSTNTVFQNQYTNTAKATIYGIELGGAYRLPEKSGLSILYSAALSRGDDDTKDEPLASINPFKLVAGVRYLSNNKKLTSEVIATHSGKARVSSTSTTYVPDAQTVLDFINKYKFNDQFDFNIGIYNLADVKYFEYSDVRTVASSTNTDLIDSYSQPGRNVKAGFKFSF